MLSIDEVITALEQGPRSNIRDDAVTYLTEYKGLSKMWNDKLDKEQENSSLTWDELKAMEGKPVWVEWHDHKEWFLIDSIDKKKVVFRAQSGFGWHCTRRESETWQAYRKERA